MARKSGLVVRNGRSRRSTVWLFGTPVGTALAAANTAVLSHTLNAAALALTPFTIVRTRGTMLVESDQNAASEFYQVSTGMAVVSAQAAAIGVTAVPTPETDRGSDLFFVYETLEALFELGDATGFISAGGVRKDWDSKAMRKVNDDEQVILTSETSALSSGAIVRTAFRMLVKLH